MRPYEPSNRLSFVGFVAMLVVGVLFAVILGAIAAAVGTAIYLVPLSAIILAFLAGGVAQIAVRVGRVRAPLFAFVVGLVLGVIVYGSYRVGNYIYALYQISQLTPSKNADIVQNLLDARDELEIVIARETDGSSGLIGFILFEASEGMEITRGFSSSSSSLTLDRNATLALWGGEFLLVLLWSAFAARSQARKPYLEKYNRWLSKADYRRLGTVDLRQKEAFMQRLETGDFRGAGFLVMPAPSAGQLWIDVARVGENEENVLLKLTEPTGRSRRERLGMVTWEQYQGIISGIDARLRGMSR